MKKSFRVLSMTLSAVMLLGLATGCGGKETASSDITTISIWSGNTHSKDVDTASWKEWNETVGKENGFYVDFQVKGGDSISQTMELAIQSGTAPDFISGDLNKLVENGDVIAYDDLPGLEDIIKDYKDKGLLEETRGMYKGKTYSLPSSVTTMGIVYNRDMFKKAGIVDEKGEPTPPKTWAEVRDYAKRLTDESKKEYGIIYPLKWGGWFNSDIACPAVCSTGFMNFNPVTGKFEYDGMKTAMEAIVGMYNDGSVYPGADGMDNDSARALFAEGVVGMKFAFSFDVGVLNDQFPAKCDWGVAPHPTYTEGVAYKQFSEYGYGSYINAKTKVDHEKLAKFIRLREEKDQLEGYKNCVSIPIDISTIDGVKPYVEKTGWDDFVKMVAKSESVPLTPKQTFGGLEEPKTIFVNSVLKGTMTVDEGIALMNKNANEAMENYFAENPDEDRELYHDPNWKPQPRD
ncbi:MAG: ABC transporter substrate-binding protein [Clostridiales bacterium]|nr:ABC transporter substrate-binding protein [Clostridiales bacterium]